jgi:hypothetical protein
MNELKIKKRKPFSKIFTPGPESVSGTFGNQRYNYLIVSPVKN